MGSRRTARERALQALYQLEVSPSSVDTALAQAWAASDDEEPQDEAATRFAQELVNGVQANAAELDRLIEANSHNWRLERMSRIDRNILRLGTFELSKRDDIPKKVSINEAVEMAKKFGTEESFAFINGLLDRIATAVNKA